jgi:hypothetical protein
MWPPPPPPLQLPPPPNTFQYIDMKDVELSAFSRALRDMLILDTEPVARAAAANKLDVIIQADRRHKILSSFY